MDNPNITIEEYTRLEEEKARRHSRVYNWKTATYSKIWNNEDVHDLRSVETEFQLSCNSCPQLPRWFYDFWVKFEERFYTLAKNPVKEILLKLNLPNHRILKDGGEDQLQQPSNEILQLGVEFLLLPFEQSATESKDKQHPFSLV
ncbi:hypothetical protein Tco_0995242 [Tanacetum coccineum]